VARTLRPEGERGKLAVGSWQMRTVRLVEFARLLLADLDDSWPEWRFPDYGALPRIPLPRSVADPPWRTPPAGLTQNTAAGDSRVRVTPPS